jgi:hypothetical protein
VESFAAAGQRGRGRVRVVAAVEHALHAVTLPVMDDGLPGLGKLAAARWVGRGGGDGQRCFPVKFAQIREGRDARGRGAAGYLASGRGAHSWPMFARLMVKRRRLRRMR